MARSPSSSWVRRLAWVFPVLAAAAISASPATTTIVVDATVPESPAANAKGTVSPSDMPITTSRTVAEASKWDSTCGVEGIRKHHTSWLRERG